MTGPAAHCYVIAEVGINHNGSLEIAKELVDMAVETGCDAVKFQKRTIDVVYPADLLDQPRESPFGTTVAHGNLTLSLIDGFRKGLVQSTGFKLGVNYGWNKVRFPAPVPAGARLRATSEVVSVEEVGGGRWQVATKFTLEVEGNEKPACVAESVGRALV